MDLRNGLYLRGYCSCLNRVLQRGDVSFITNSISTPVTDSVQSMYDRTLKPIPPRLSTGFRYRFETLIGITGVRMAKYRSSWSTIVFATVGIVWRPHLLAILIFEVRSLHSVCDFDALLMCDE